MILNASETPNEIVAKAKCGDREAFGQLYELLKTSVWGLAYSILGDPTSTEEVVGDSFLAMIDQADQLPDDFVAVAAWMRTVAKRKCMDLFRRSKLHRNGIQTLIGQDSPLVASNGNGQTRCSRVDAGDSLESTEAIAELTAAIEQLSSDHQLAIQWRYFDDLSLAEIGRRLGASPSATNSLLFRARNQLRSTLSSSRLDACSAVVKAPAESASSTAKSTSARNSQITPINRSAK